MQQATLDLLVIAAKAGNKEAFGKLYEYFQQPTLRFSYKLCSNASIAQDATQEAWISCAKSIRKLADIRQFRAWLFRTVRWRTIDQLRQQLPSATDDVEMSTDVAGAQQVDGVEQEELHHLIAALPQVEREAIYLFYLEQLRIQEIAVVLGIPNGTVKSRLNRARQHLRERYIEK